MKKKIFFVAAVIFSSQLKAQDTAVRTLDEVVVTANKFEQKQSTTGKVVSVITKEQLEKSIGKTLSQVLNEQAGITISGAYNTLGSVQTVLMRGASTGRTQILLDGIPMNDPSMIYNEFDLNLFSINDIEKIEICKGAQSTLYGSDAIAGVINIISVKKDVTKSFNIKAANSYGNKNTIRNNLQLFGKAGKLEYTTRFAKCSTDGFSSAHDNTGNGNFDKDGYDGNVVNATLQYHVTSALSFKTFIQHSQYKADVDAGVFTDDKDYTIHNSNFSSGFAASFKKGIFSIKATYQYDELSRKYKNDSLDVSGFNKFESNKYWGRTHYAELYGNIAAAKWLTILAGFDYLRAFMKQQYYSVSNYGPYAPPTFDSSLYQTSFYGSLLFNAIQKKLNIEMGGRINDHSQYGNNSTYTLNPSYTINKNWRLFGSIASGFKVPSIFQLYDAFSGNKNLKPEKSVNFEGGIELKYEKISTRIVYFHRNIRNAIDFDYTTFKYFNFVKQTVNGIELETSLQPIKQLTITANYAFIEGEEKTQSRKDFNDTTYNYLLRRPEHNLNLTIGYRFCSALYASLNGKYISSRYDIGGYAADDVLLNNYFLVNAYAEYKWKSSVKFFADLQNITNKKFFDIRGYNSIPFLINGGITFSW